MPLSSVCGTCKTFKTRFCFWLSGQSPEQIPSCSLFARKQKGSKGRVCDFQPSPLNPQPATPNPQPSTLDPRPSNRNPQSSTHNPQPATRNAQPSTHNAPHQGIAVRIVPVPRFIAHPRILLLDVTRPFSIDNRGPFPLRTLHFTRLQRRGRLDEREGRRI